VQCRCRLPMWVVAALAEPPPPSSSSAAPLIVRVCWFVAVHSWSRGRLVGGLVRLSCCRRAVVSRIVGSCSGLGRLGVWVVCSAGRLGRAREQSSEHLGLRAATVLRVVWVDRVPSFNNRLGLYLIRVFSSVTRWSYLGNRYWAIRVQVRVFRVQGFGLGFYAQC
jgi:hypothetical protein